MPTMAPLTGPPGLLGLNRMSNCPRIGRSTPQVAGLSADWRLSERGDIVAAIVSETSCSCGGGTMKWEYYRLATVEACLDDALYELGQDGWELVSVMPEARLFHGFQCLLKRPYTGKDSPRSNHPSVPHRMNKYISTR